MEKVFCKNCIYRRRIQGITRPGTFRCAALLLIDFDYVSGKKIYKKPGTNKVIDNRDFEQLPDCYEFNKSGDCEHYEVRR